MEHRFGFGKVSVLATMSSTIYRKKLEWTWNADQLKFNGRFGQINICFIGPAIVAFVCRKQGNFLQNVIISNSQDPGGRYVSGTGAIAPASSPM